MSKTLSEVMNIGIPVYEFLELETFDLNQKCSTIDTRKKFEQINNKARSNFQHKIGRNSINKHISLLSRIHVNADDTALSDFHCYGQELIGNAYRQLADVNIYTKVESVEYIIQNRLEELRERLVFITNHPYTTEFHNSLKDNFADVYYGREMGIDLRYYLRTEYEFYKELYDYIQNYGYPDINIEELLDEYKKTLDVDKVGLFLVYNYMLKIDGALKIGDYALAQEYLFYVRAYLQNKDNKNAYMHIGFRKTISYSDINDYYLKLLKTYPFLNTIYLERDNFTRLSDAESRRLASNIANMRRIKTSKLDIKSATGTKEESEQSTSRTVTTKTEAEQAAIDSYVEDKLLVYLQHEPIAQIVGTNSFNKYVGFLYPNGNIPADRLLKVNRLSETKQDAIFLFDISNYEALMSLSRPELWEMGLAMKHSKKWKEKLADYATKTTTPELEQKASEFVKKRSK